METCALFFDVSVQARKMQPPLWKEIAQLAERCLIAEVVGPNPILFLFSMENDISLGQFDRWLYGALRKSDTPSRVKPKEPWPYRVVAGLNRVLEILLDSILEDFI